MRGACDAAIQRLGNNTPGLLRKLAKTGWLVENNNMEWLHKTEKYLTKQWERFSLLAVVFGFICDSWFLSRIDFLPGNIVLFSYIVVSGFCIILLNLIEAGRIKTPFFKDRVMLFTLIMQFVFGNLFSGFVVSYSQGGAFYTSWPFIIMLVAFLFGNEFVLDKYEKFTFQMSIYFTAVFSFSIFFVPILLNRFGVDTFLIGGVLSLGLVSGILYTLSRFNKDGIRKSRNGLIASIGGIYILFNIMYFTNIIPPVPLSIKNIGVYHLVEKQSNGKYLLSKEVQNNWWPFANETIHITQGNELYCFSSVFAPTDIKTKIFHRWERYDEKNGKWVEMMRFSYPIVGGKDYGYRGYTIKENVTAGLWRCDVITERDQIVGRVKFKVVVSDVKPVIVSEIK